MNGQTASNNLQVARVFAGEATNIEASAMQQRDYKPPAFIFALPKFEIPLPATLPLTANVKDYAPLLNGRNKHYAPSYKSFKVPAFENMRLVFKDQQYQDGWVLVND